LSDRRSLELLAETQIMDYTGRVRLDIDSGPAFAQGPCLLVDLHVKARAQKISAADMPPMPAPTTAIDVSEAR
jgi:hypothetical protein